MVDRILELINNSNMSDFAICQALSLGNGIIGKWRKGLQKPSVDAVVKIAEYFGVSTDYILMGKELGNLEISSIDQEWLSLIHQLPPEAQWEFRGEIKGYLKRLDEESVAADQQLRQAK